MNGSILSMPGRLRGLTIPAKEPRPPDIYTGYPDQNRCIFIHIPKTAGTSVTRSLFDCGSNHYPYFEFHKVSRWKFYTYFKFTFVRNPWDRLVSAFHFLKEGGLAPVDKVWADEALGPFPDFDCFVRQWVNGTNIWSWVHFKPQHHYVCSPRGSVRVNFVGRTERMDEDFGYVARRLGKKVELRHENKSARTHYRDYYDSTTREIVRRVYERDIATFKYDF